MLIFAILTGIAFFGISVYTAQANETRVASDLGTFEVAIKDYMLNNPGACSDGTLSPVGLNHYLTKENTLALDEADPNKDDLGSEISVAAGVKGEVAYKKLSVLEDPWGHRYRVVIRNNADRTTEEGEYGAKGTDRAFIYVYSMGKDGKGAANDTKQDDSVLCVQYSDGEVYSRAYLPSDGKNQAITDPAYTYWNKDENGKHSVMKDSIFAVGTVDPSKAPGKENGSSGGIGGGGSNVTSNYAGWYVTNDYAYMRAPTAGNELGFTSIEEGKRFIKEVYIKVATGMTWDEFVRATLSDPDNEGLTEEQLASGIYADVGLDESSFVPATLSDEWTVMVIDKEKTSYGALETMINGYPVTSLAEAFKGCTNMKTAPSIPASIKDMSSTFEGCTSLTGAIDIACNPAEYENCFKDTVESIVLKGKSVKRFKLAETSSNDNVTPWVPELPCDVYFGYNVVNGNDVEIASTFMVGDYYKEDQFLRFVRDWSEKGGFSEYFGGDYSKKNVTYIILTMFWGADITAEEFNDVNYAESDYEEILGWTLVSISQHIEDTVLGDVVIPSRINETGLPDKNGKYRVVRIAANGFSQSNVKSVSLPNSVTEIGNNAFYRCYEMTSINLGQGLVSIGDNAFEDCQKLTGVTLPNSVTTVGANAFECCSKLAFAKIGSGIKNIPNGMFVNCTSLSSITIPNSVLSIGESAFSNCKGLKNVTIPENVTTILPYAFYNCTSLEKINYNATRVQDNQYTSNMPYIFSGAYIYGGNDYSGPTTKLAIGRNVEHIPAYMFSRCYGIKALTIPGNVKSVGENAFFDCKYIETINLCNGIETIGESAFQGIAAASIVIPSSVKFIGQAAFAGCKKLTQFPNSITNISEQVFREAGIKTATIPNTITHIGREAFYKCIDLTNVSIPSSVTDIAAFAFYGCTKLTDIYFSGTKAQWDTISQSPTWLMTKGYCTIHCSDSEFDIWTTSE